MISCQEASEHAVFVAVEILPYQFVSSVNSAALLSHSSENRSLFKPLVYPAAQEEYARSEFSRRNSEVTSHVYALSRVFPRALNSFRAAKETAIETTT